VTNDAGHIELEGDNLVNSENFDQKHDIIVQDGGYTAKWSKKRKIRYLIPHHKPKNKYLLLFLHFRALLHFFPTSQISCHTFQNHAQSLHETL
jgi:hypothetical protein